MPIEGRRGWRRGLATVAIGLILSTAGDMARAAPKPASGPNGPASASVSPDWRWLPGERPDLAPAGLPDFSQCRRGWSQSAIAPGRPPQWTYAGPVALAAALWWLDSRAEPGDVAPPQVSDGHGLVTAYPVFGRARDDHDPANLPLLVEDLALRAATDGRGSSTAGRGTSWPRLREALADYLGSRRLAELYRVEVGDRPDAEWLRPRQEEGAAFVLALGVWERQGETWQRVGGHYAGLAGLGRSPAGAADWLALADPLADQAALGGAGRALPPGPELHSCRLAPAAHDDPATLSHDGYALAERLPDGRQLLQGYFGLEAQGEAAAFAGQNAFGPPPQRDADWQGGAVVMALDAALAILPDPRLLPPTATATASATASTTASAAATATATITAIASATASPTATASGSATTVIPTADAGNPQILRLPWLSSGD